MKSSVSKRSIVIAGHKTSVSLEDQFWDSLKEIARERGTTLGALVAAIDGNRQHAAAWNKLVDQPWRIMSIGLRQWAHGF